MLIGNAQYIIVSVIKIFQLDKNVNFLMHWTVLKNGYKDKF